MRGAAVVMPAAPCFFCPKSNDLLVLAAAPDLVQLQASNTHKKSGGP
jgi:hypothetical protein